MQFRYEQASRMQRREALTAIVALLSTLPIGETIVGPFAVTIFGGKTRRFMASPTCRGYSAIANPGKILGTVTPVELTEAGLQRVWGCYFFSVNRLYDDLKARSLAVA